MRTSCTHCGTHFKVPDKTLGKQAKCKSCGKMFVITPVGEEHDVPMQEVRPPSRHGSTAQIDPVKHDEVDSDPLGALADAAVESGSHMRPVHGVPASSRQRDYDPGDDDGYGQRVRKAKGAGLAMGLGITAGVLGVIGFIIGLIAMFGVGQDLMVILGVVALIFIALTAILGMMAVVNGATAAKHIRRARHPLAGKGNASTGVILGWLSLGLVLIAIVTGGIWLSTRGGISFDKQVDAQGNPIEPGTKTKGSTGTTGAATPGPKTPGPTTPGNTQPTTGDPNSITQEEAETAAQVFLGFACCLGVFSLVAFAFWLWMLIDCCTAKFPPEQDNKTMWVLLIIFLGALGALIYFFAGRPKKGRSRGRARYAR